jgi:hypothetical protein
MGQETSYVFWHIGQGKNGFWDLKIGQSEDVSRF